MEILNFNIESWWSVLKYLSRDIKLELAGRLINSLKEDPIPPKEEKDDWLKLYGAWREEEQTAEELIDLIKSSRISTRQIESLD
ncbi:MAG: hypothetical protein AAGJ18_22280 [Bacteroidota bacterium]